MVPYGSPRLIKTQSLFRLYLQRVVFQGRSRSRGQHRESVKRLSKHLPTDTWRHRPTINASLDPIPGDTHSYPVESDRPSCTVGSGLRDGDVDLKRWLFGCDGYIVIEKLQPCLERRL